MPGISSAPNDSGHPDILAQENVRDSAVAAANEGTTLQLQHGSFVVDVEVLPAEDLAYWRMFETIEGPDSIFLYGHWQPNRLGGNGEQVANIPAVLNANIPPKGALRRLLGGSAVEVIITRLTSIKRTS